MISIKNQIITINNLLPNRISIFYLYGITGLAYGTYKVLSSLRHIYKRRQSISTIVRAEPISPTTENAIPQQPTTAFIRNYRKQCFITLFRTDWRFRKAWHKALLWWQKNTSTQEKQVLLGITTPNASLQTQLTQWIRKNIKEQSHDPSALKIYYQVIHNSHQQLIQHSSPKALRQSIQSINQALRQCHPDRNGSHEGTVLLLEWRKLLTEHTHQQLELTQDYQEIDILNAGDLPWTIMQAYVVAEAEKIKQTYYAQTAPDSAIGGYFN